MKKVCVAILVSYNPDSDKLNQLIRMLSGQVKKIILVDNNSNNLSEIKLMNNCELIGLEKNYGLGYAQNIGIQKAERDKHIEFLVFFDQDSTISEDYIFKMEKFYKLNQDNCKIGAIGTAYYDRNMMQYSRLINVHHRKAQKQYHPNEATMIISSGSFMPISTIKKCGLFNASFFIDYIDIEYCLRILKNDLVILVNDDIIMEHAIGIGKTHKILGLLFKPNHHNPLRKYYMTRNMILTWRYHKDIKGITFLFFSRYIYEVMNILFFEKEKLKKIWKVIQGTTSGLFSKINANNQ